MIDCDTINCMNKTIPAAFQPLIPSVPVEKLDIHEDKAFIIESLLKQATFDAWLWLLDIYPREDIIEIIKKSPRLGKKDVMFWSYYYQIPTEEISCIQKKSQNGLKSSWAY